MSKEWAKGSIDYTGVEGGNPFERYERVLGVRESQIKGIVLDLGAGSDCKPAGRLKGADVISMSPDFENPRKLSAIGRVNANEKACAGLGQELPFKDGVVDVVFGFNVLDYIRNKVQVVEETMRVLRPGGTAYFGPDIPRTDDEEFNKRRGIKVEKCGVIGRRFDLDPNSGHRFECTRTIIIKPE